MRLEQNSSAHALVSGTSAAELRFFHLAETSLLAHRQQLELDLARAQHLRDLQQRAFQKARLERETLETLREQQLSQYQQEQTRREQRELDEMFLSRRSFGKRG